MRDHQPQTIDAFNGYFNRGDVENTPVDHFQASGNMRHQGKSIFTRDGITISQDVNAVTPLTNVRRIYNYPTITKNTQIVLSYDPNTNTGKIYHVVDSTHQFGPILSIVGMVDFAFIPFGGRAYISPFFTDTDGFDKGLSGEFLYVYAGDGTAARKAAGVGMGGGMTIAAGAAGNTDAGLHVYGVVSTTKSGYQSPPSSLGTFTNIPGQSVSFGNIPTSGDPNVISRQIVASKAISSFNGNLEGYDLFFIPNGVIPNNTATFLNNISFFDADLVSDASHLFDNYTSIPAGAFLTEYHGRLVLGATFADINLVLVSQAGEPEAINQISGLLSTQPNGFPVSNAAEFRDVLYVFRPNSGMSFTDNGGDPSSWPLVDLEGALGARPHAIAQYLNSQTQSVDFLIIGTYQGISLFTGGFQSPELSWKVETFWRGQDRTQFRNLQIIVNTVKKRIYAVLPDRTLLVGFFQNGLNPSDIQWEPWNCVQPINTIAVTGIDEDIIGCDIY